MSQYEINTDFFAIVSNTSNRFSAPYIEAVNDAKEGGSKTDERIKNFLISIDNVASKREVNDTTISKSRGNIKKLSIYDSIEKCVRWVNSSKISGTKSIVKDINATFKSLNDNSAYYEDAYNKNIKLVILEYECAVYMLSTVLSMILAYNAEVMDNDKPLNIKDSILGKDFGLNGRTFSKLTKEIAGSKHKEYLKAIIDLHNKDKEAIKESVYTEDGNIVDTVLSILDLGVKGIKSIKDFSVALFTTVRSNLFGIIPIIRSIVYLRYKRKADCISNLEHQVEDLERNIEQLKLNTTIDAKKKEGIIKRQQAYIDAYKKKAAKLRAQFEEGEKDAANAIKKEDPKMDDDNDDFIIESAELLYLEASGYRTSPKRNTNIVDTRITNVMGKHKKPGNIHSYTERNHKEYLDKFKKAANVRTDEEILRVFKTKVFPEIKKGLKRRDTIKFQVGSMMKSDNIKYRTKCKIGGTPYWPKDKADEYNNLFSKYLLVAQINFAEIPAINGFPTKGILQIYTNDLAFNYWGIMTNTAKSKCKLYYHETVGTEFYDGIKLTTCTTKTEDYVFKGMYLLKGKKASSYNVTPGYYEDVKNYKDFYDLFSEACNRLYGVPLDIYDLTYRASNETTHKCYDLINNEFGFWGTRIGGYPSFTQWIPAFLEKKDYQLLFQMDSEGSIMWGDAGIANWHIAPKDLASLNFAKTYFTWDCC